MKHLFVLLVLAVAGCVSSTHVSEQDLAAIVALARTKTSESGLLRPEEMQQVRDTAPKVNYYFLARPLADYSVRWTVNQDEIIVHGRGDFLRLENAAVERMSKPSR